MMRKTIKHSISRKPGKKTVLLQYLVVLPLIVTASLGVLLLMYMAYTLPDNNNHNTSPVAVAGKNIQQPVSQSETHNAAIQRGDVGAVKNNNNIQPDVSDTQAKTNVHPAIQRIRDEFHHRYGDIDKAQTILDKGVQRFGDIQATANRLLLAQAAKRPFVLAFAGYSVTVGRGNYFRQSFPFVLEGILKPLLQETFQLDIIVRNAAIGGIPSYPYAFCFEHFLDQDPDVISWDYSMNEGNGAAVLESYIRQSQHQLSKRPMLIALDTNQQRCKLLQQYTSAGLLPDALCVGKAKDVVETRFLDLPDDQKPPGFQHWNEFGAPASCPGRGSWHPKKMEHELIAWMMAMYFVDAIEEAQKTKTSFHEQQSSQSVVAMFPPPFQHAPSNEKEVTELLYGHVNDQNQYVMKDLSCRTNFLPASDKDKVLPSIVVSGLAPGITADNIMETRSDQAYQSGWVLDVSSLERETKVKVERCGGLGYIDMKIALYGIPQSGTLRLWLPMEGHGHDDHGHNDDMTAKHWFDDLVICEANEKRPPGACQLDTDIEYTVGGVKVPSTKMIAGAGEYLKRKTCVNVGVPTDAQVTKLGNVQNSGGIPLTQDARIRLSSQNALKSDHVGLVVDIKAKDNVSRDKGACCISHVVWEQH